MPVSRQSRALGVLGLCLTGLLLVAGAAAQGGAAPFAIRYTGTVTLQTSQFASSHASRPAPQGTVITLFAVRSETDLSRCGNAVVSDAQGHYTIDVQPAQGCVPAAAAPRGCSSTTSPCCDQFMFVVNSENVGGDCPRISLDQPASLGKMQQVQLRGTDIPALPASAANRATLPFFRIVGSFQVNVRGNWSAAPQGTRLLAFRLILACSLGRFCVGYSGGGAASTQEDTGRPVQDQSASAQPICGTGSVTDGQGDYYVDVEAVPECTDPIPGTLTDLHYGVIAEDFSAGDEDEDGDGLGGFCWDPLFPPPVFGHAFPHPLQGQIDNSSGQTNTPLRATLYTPQDLQTAPIAGVPPGPVPTPIPGASPVPIPVPGDQDIRIAGDKAFQDFILDCFQNSVFGFRNVRGSPAVSKILSDLNMGGSTVVTIAPWSQLGENLADYDHGLAAAGTPTSATIDVAPQTSPTTGFGEFPSPPGFAAVLWNDCAELFHELKHAQEAVTGTVPARLANNQPDYATKRMKDGNLITVSELNAVTAENIYRISVGLPPLREYTYEGEWVTLDEEYVHPPTP